MSERKGTVNFKENIQEYIEFFEKLDIDTAEAKFKEIEQSIGKIPYRNSSDPITFAEIARNCAASMLKVSGWASWPPEKTKEAKWPKHREAAGGRIRQFVSFATDFSQQIQVGYWIDNIFAYLYLGNSEKGIIVLEPEKYLEYFPEKDYSNISPSQIKALCGEAAEGAIDLIDSPLTVNSLTTHLSTNEQSIKDIQQEIDAAIRHEHPELIELNNKIEALKNELSEKRDKLMQELNKKMDELEEQKETLESQIYLLDSQIYAIRCYTGEVVNFATIVKGRPAQDNEPIIIYQKLRFLDEELGKLASLYEIQWDKLHMFEEFLRYHPLAIQTFAPNDRCVSLIRLSRNATQYGRDNDHPCSNVLKEYEYYHGKTVGIIIRNGENVYLGWCDEKRVHIEDDFIVSQIVTETTPYNEPKFTFESERKEWIKKQRLERRQFLDGVVSRAFVYNILQGVVDNTPILPLPKGTKLNKQSDMVIYSLADKWLSDNRYGDFGEIVARCNAKPTKGDYILTTQHIEPEFYEYGWNGRRNMRYETWFNPRGRGVANRTHDAHVDDCTIYSINVIDSDKPVSKTRYKYLITPDNFTLQKNPNAKPYWKEYVCDTDEYKRRWEDDDPNNVKHEVIEVFDYIEHHVFVSVKKTSARNWEGYAGDARANVELHKHEYMNLTYLNSVWLEWVITTQKLGSWTAGSNRVDYAYAIRYLKTALEHIREREREEKSAISSVAPSICEDPNWPIKLSEWKLENGVRKITEYQAKRFARFLGYSV